MNLYIETNFILEMVFAQAGHQACEQILALPHSHLTILVPASCFMEAEYKKVAKMKEVKESADLARMALERLAYSSAPRTPDFSVPLELNVFAAEAREHYLSTFERLISVLVKRATIIPLGASTLSLVHETSRVHGLDLPDAIVLNAVLNDLDDRVGTAACFVARDAHFSRKTITDALRERDCKYLANFSDTLAHLKSELRL